MKRLLCLVLACVLALGLIGCVDQHPEGQRRGRCR